MPTIFEILSTTREAIYARAKRYMFGSIQAILSILTEEEPSLPGHSDQGHNTSIIALSTREVIEKDKDYDTVYQLLAIVCLTCQSEPHGPHGININPFNLFATSHQVRT